jgi:NAD-dependent dihydropyrimidine dehydrogenase PreA subunit
MKRKIIRIDEEKCNGCGQCIPSCAEGALQIVNGKARLITDKLCDGLGACLGDCPQGALIIDEREADAFDESAVDSHLASLQAKKETATNEQSFGCGCPGTHTRVMAPKKQSGPIRADSSNPSELSHWPVQIRLMNPSSDFLKNADLLITADCVPFAYADFHRKLLRGRVVAVGCPKLDDATYYMEKLTEIFRQNQLNSITVAYMEVPCCTGLLSIVRQAVRESGCALPVKAVKVAMDGTILEQESITV